jgi:hypothetical protein
MSVIFILSCQTHGQMLELLSAKRGNTGHRGIVPKEDMDKPLEGHDYYIVELKALKKTTLELVSMMVNKEDKGFKLEPTFDDKSKIKTVNAGDIVYIYAENNDTAQKSKVLFNLEGQLTVKAHGKLKTVDIKVCEMIMPQ